MMDFIYDLYQNDNFVLYLTIALVVLVVLFVVVLFFGKKDQKLEETKRLQKLELDTFKEEKTEPTKVEVSEVKEELPNEVVKEEPKVEEEKPVKSIFDETSSIPLVKEEVSEDVKIDEPQNVEVTTFEPIIKEDKPKVEEEKMVSLVEEDDKPLFMPSSDVDDIGKDLSELEKLKEEFRNMDLPKEEKIEENKVIEEDIFPSRLDRKVEEEKPLRMKDNTEEKKYKPSSVFSSVFVNNNEEKPEVKEEVKKEVKEEPKKVSLFTIEDDDLELPTLKKEEQKENINLDNITGETYNINR